MAASVRHLSVHSSIGLFVTLSEAIGSLGCKRNGLSGSMLIRQLTTESKGITISVMFI